MNTSSCRISFNINWSEACRPPTHSWPAIDRDILIIKEFIDARHCKVKIWPYIKKLIGKRKLLNIIFPELSQSTIITQLQHTRMDDAKWGTSYISAIQETERALWCGLAVILIFKVYTPSEISATGAEVIEGEIGPGWTVLDPSKEVVLVCGKSEEAKDPINTDDILQVCPYVPQRRDEVWANHEYPDN